MSFHISRTTLPSAVPLVVPARKAASQRHDTHLQAFALYSGDLQGGQAQGLFSFIRPDMPPLVEEEQRQKAKFVVVPQTAAKPSATNFSPSVASASPRFRSALEQVSYYTNQSQFKAKK